MIICVQFGKNLRCRVLWLGRSVMECPCCLAENIPKQRGGRCRIHSKVKAISKLFPHTSTQVKVNCFVVKKCAWERGREGGAEWGREGGAVRGAPGIRRDECIGKKSSRIRCLLIVLCHSHLMENRREEGRRGRLTSSGNWT